MTRANVKSKVIVPSSTLSSSQANLDSEVDEELTDKVEFEEDGEIINMEINDGGAGAAEFASEDEMESADEEESFTEANQSDVER